MTLTELESLIEKVEEVQKETIALKRTVDRRWDLFITGNGRYGMPIESIIEHLRVLATPPKPPNVMISVPFEWAVKYASKELNINIGGRDVVQANCRTAIAPYQPPK